MLVTVARDIMSTELIVAHEEMTLEEAIKTIVNNRITGMPVIDQKKRLVGVCSEYDIIKLMDNNETDRPLNLKNKIKFSSKVVTIREDTPLREILRLFVDKKIRRLPVLNEKEELVGIISRRDIMRVAFYRSKNL